MTKNAASATTVKGTPKRMAGRPASHAIFTATEVHRTREARVTLPDDPRKRIAYLVCWAVGALTRRDVDADLLRGMIWSNGETACLQRGKTPGGRWRYEADVSRAIRKLEKQCVLLKVGHGVWSVQKDIEREVDRYARDIA